jgi:hypothetical protein
MNPGERPWVPFVTRSAAPLRPPGVSIKPDGMVMGVVKAAVSAAPICELALPSQEQPLLESDDPAEV